MFFFSGDGGSSVDHRPNKRKASDGLFGRVHHFVTFTDVDYQPCHGDATQEGAITLSSKRRAVNNDHCYYAVPMEVSVDPLPSRDYRQLAVRHARRSVKRAVRRIVSNKYINNHTLRIITQENSHRRVYELNSVQKLCGTGFSQFPLLYVVLGPTSLREIYS